MVSGISPREVRRPVGELRLSTFVENIVDRFPPREVRRPVGGVVKNKKL